MNSKKWFLVQLILWFCFWIIFRTFQQVNLTSLLDNLATYLFQIGLIAVFIFVISPAFFLKKKYLQLLVVSVFTIGLLTFTYESTFRTPPSKAEQNRPNRPPPPEINKLANALLFSFTYLLALFFEGVQLVQRQEKLVLQSKSSELDAELKMLKMQINPHFLFNTLNNIYALSSFDVDKTRQSITYLSRILRYVVYDCEQPLVTIQQEVAYIEDYLQLFALKSFEKFPIQWTKDIKDATVLIAPMLFIPFVENALKHSQVDNAKAAFVAIELTVDSNLIRFIVENSIPSGTTRTDATRGIGLKNVRKRLALLYPNRHQLAIVEEEAIFKIDLQINPSNNA